LVLTYRDDTVFLFEPSALVKTLTVKRAMHEAILIARRTPEMNSGLSPKSNRQRESFGLSLSVPIHNIFRLERVNELVCSPSIP